MAQSVRCVRCGALALGPPANWHQDSRDPERWLCRQCLGEFERRAMSLATQAYFQQLELLVRGALGHLVPEKRQDHGHA